MNANQVTQRERDILNSLKLNECNPGDKILLTDGRVAEFIRLKRTKFEGLINGEGYNIPVQMFVKVESKAPDKTEEINSLKAGDAFYVNKDGDALLFYFVERRGVSIVGKHPIKNTNTTIPFYMFGGKV